MISMQRGFRGKLSQYLDLNNTMEVKMAIDGPSVYDFCCFGVNDQEKLADDRYMVFYNQVNSPNGEISYTSQGNASASFSIKLTSLPPSIQKLVFTASIDGQGTMGQIAFHRLQLNQNSNTILDLNIEGQKFKDERAITSVEIYLKSGEWRICAVASGFNGGLSALLAHYGGEEIADTPAPQPIPQPQASTRPHQPPQTQAHPLNQPVSPSPYPVHTPSPAPAPYTAPAPVQPTSPSGYAPFSQGGGSSNSRPHQKIDLEKRVREGAPKLLSLVKPLKIQLTKHNLSDCVARVGLVMDASGSMIGRYTNGTVSDICKRILPLALQFDDDGQLDCWFYSAIFKRMPAITMKNYEQAVPFYWPAFIAGLGVMNYEPLVMNSVFSEYKDGVLPAYVIFITDGCVDATESIRDIIVKSSRYPIFWQFVGVGGSEYDYGILESLGTQLPGSYVKNASFFALDDFKKVSDEQLYSKLLRDFPQWLEAAKSCGIIS